MKYTSIVLCSVAVVLVGLSRPVAAEEPQPGSVSREGLSSLGLSGMQPISRAEGQAIRGKGFGFHPAWVGYNTNQVLAAFNTQSDLQVYQGGAKNDNYAEFVGNWYSSAWIKQSGRGNLNEALVNSNADGIVKVGQSGKYALNRTGVQFNKYSDTVVRQSGVKTDNMALIQSNFGSYVNVKQGGYGTYNRAWASNNYKSIVQIYQH
jgi:hypothetical protein